ncbi:MAG: PilN domain-containing protein [Dokdonella sp.]
MARLRTRLAKTPLPRFFAWWGHELLACLPARWRALVSEKSESLLLDLRSDEIIVWRERGATMHEYAHIRRELPAETQGAEFRRLRAALDDPMARTVFCIPAERVLTRTLSLPVAAEENLRQVLGFEMDRQTPFKADQVYFDSRVLGHDASGRNAKVELVLIPRAQLDQELAALPAGAADLDGVDSWRSAPGAGRHHTNLLPPERRARRRNLRVPLSLGLGALAVILFVFNMDESLSNRASAVESMRAEVEKANTEAKQVAALKKTLADSIAGANFLTERKRKGPLTVALIEDLTKRLPKDAYLERLQIENKQVQLQGQAQEAAKLIGLLAASPCLGDPGFQGQVQPDPRTGKERFQINADLKECSPLTDASAPSAAPVAATEKPSAPPVDVAKSKTAAGPAVKPSAPMRAIAPVKDAEAKHAGK